MSNTKQNNEIEHINKEISLLRERLKINEKGLNQFQNGLTHIRKIRVKKGKTMDLSQTKKIQNRQKNVFQNKIKQIKKNANLLQNTLAHVKKKKDYLKKKKKKKQNLSQNEFNQIAEISGQSRDELEQIAKLRRIKNYEEMVKEELIISLLKSKHS